MKADKDAGWKWDHTYAQLPPDFFSKVHPTPVDSPNLVLLNRPLAIALGLDPEVLSKAASVFAGNNIPTSAAPLAQAYAGHQYGGFTRLGDGRAILLGEHITPSGARYDIQLKGPGRTPYSRGGDGRAALGPMLREYIISEAMAALGIPTTRSLAVATTGEEVVRSEILPGAVLTRIASSHIRVGTFQYAATLRDPAALRALADYSIHRHFPEILESENRYIDFFYGVMERQASLIAKWLHVGFVHGVMNTDNMAISGDTIDYGPCAFIDDYDPKAVFSSIDRYGRYAYDQQAQIARWNLARLAESLLPLFSENSQKAVDLANEALGSFEGRFQHYWLTGMRAKIGLITRENEDAELVQDLLDWMQASRQDFTQTFRALSDVSALNEPIFIDPGFLPWHEKWTSRLSRQAQDAAECVATMSAHNPKVIPRNHKVEEALAAATYQEDLSLTTRLVEALSMPFSEAVPEEYTTRPPADSPAYQTFCGT